MLSRTTWLATALAVGLIALAAPAVVKYAQSADYSRQYGPDPAQVVHVYAAEKGEWPWPAFMLIHGGAWQDGDAEDVAPIARWLASEGITAITVNYRLTPGGARWPDIRSDIEAAFRLIRDQADEFQIDHNHIGVYGESAGGHLAAWLATQGVGQGKPDGPGCLIVFGAPWDLTNRQAIKDWVLPAVDRLIPPDRAAEASPALMPPRRAIPPSFLIHNREDVIVPLAQMEAGQKWIVDHGGYVDVRTFDGLGHGQWPEGPAMTTLMRDMLEFILERC